MISSVCVDPPSLQLSVSLSLSRSNEIQLHLISYTHQGRKMHMHPCRLICSSPGSQQRGLKDQIGSIQQACLKEKYAHWCSSILGKCLYSLMFHVVTSRTLGCHGESCWGKKNIIKSPGTGVSLTQCMSVCRWMRMHDVSLKANRTHVFILCVFHILCVCIMFI